MKSINSSLQIKQATPDDLKKIIEMKVNYYCNNLNSYPINFIKKLFINEIENRWKKQFLQGTNTLLLINKNIIIGYIQYLLHSNASIEINTIYLKPHMENKNFIKYLCLFALDLIKGKYKYLNTWIAKESHQVIKFYESLGFKITSDIRLNKIYKDKILKEVRYTIKNN